MSRLSENVSTGLWWGSRYAVVYSIVGTIIALARRSALQNYGLTLPQLIGLYVLGGISGGMITGLMLPLVRGQVSAAIVGFFVALPIMAMFGAAMYPNELWSSNFFVTSALSAGLLGPLCGIGMWRVTNRW